MRLSIPLVDRLERFRSSAGEVVQAELAAAILVWHSNEVDTSLASVPPAKRVYRIEHLCFRTPSTPTQGFLFCYDLRYFPGKELVSTMRTRLATFLAYSVAAFAHDITGNWKLNVEKSQGLDHKSSVVKIEKAEANTYKISVDTVTAAGEKRSSSYTRICDGKEHPVERANVPSGMVETCDPNTFSYTVRREGGNTTVNTVTFSPDGKTQTMHTVTTRPDGQKREHTAVYERQ